MQPLHPIKSEESPREILAARFQVIARRSSHPWRLGLLQEDACIIDKNDPLVDPSVPFDGVGLEYVFVEKRIYEEMIIFRPNEEKFSGIEWNLQQQRVFHEGGRAF